MRNTTYTYNNKQYELSIHLGNVLVTTSDLRKGADNNADGIAEYYNAIVTTANDYFAFGSLMPSRQYNSTGYVYGFNGKENDNEISDNGNQYDYGFRIYNPRLGKFISVDPLTASYSWYTPYQFAGNTPIWAFDLDGLEEAFATDFYDEKAGVYKRTITLSGEDVGAGTIQFKTIEGKIVTEIQPASDPNDISNIKELRDSKKAYDEGKSGVLIGNITRRIETPKETKPQIQVQKKDDIKKSVDNNTITNPKPNPIIKEDSPPLPTTIKGFTLGENNFAEVNSPIEYNKTIKEISNWLINNPNYNIDITTGAGVPIGKSLEDDITPLDFHKRTYWNRSNDFINKWKDDIVKYSNGKVTRDRLIIRIGNPNSYDISQKIVKRK